MFINTEIVLKQFNLHIYFLRIHIFTSQSGDFGLYEKIFTYNPKSPEWLGLSDKKQWGDEEMF